MGRCNNSFSFIRIIRYLYVFIVKSAAAPNSRGAGKRFLRNLTQTEVGKEGIGMYPGGGQPHWIYRFISVLQQNEFILWYFLVYVDAYLINKEELSVYIGTTHSSMYPWPCQHCADDVMGMKRTTEGSRRLNDGLYQAGFVYLLPCVPHKVHWNRDSTFFLFRFHSKVRDSTRLPTTFLFTTTAHDV